MSEVFSSFLMLGVKISMLWKPRPLNTEERMEGEKKERQQGNEFRDYSGEHSSVLPCFSFLLGADGKL